jgi:hypothetical protein
MIRRLPFVNDRFHLTVIALVVAITIVALPLAWYLGSPLFLDQQVNEDFPAPMAGESPSVGDARLLSRGEFGEIDAIHKGQGQAQLYQLPDGRRVLRFQHFEVQNGPDLYVYLSGHPAPRSSTELHESGAFQVGRLKGNIGDQNYELPDDLDLSQYRSAVIYCRRFSVVFSTAEFFSGS